LYVLHLLRSSDLSNRCHIAHTRITINNNNNNSDTHNKNNSNNIHNSSSETHNNSVIIIILFIHNNNSGLFHRYSASSLSRPLHNLPHTPNLSITHNNNSRA
jgi:hypothetical protein